MVSFCGIDQVASDGPSRSTMMRNVPPLRRLAIHVDEPGQGAFEWILSEVDETARLVGVQRAKSHAKTYHEAMAKGLLALQALIEDLDIGPREKEEGERVPSAPASTQAPATPDEHEAPNDPDAEQPHTHSTSESKHKPTAFGFGLPS